ncbi:spore germination protein [Alicyclobacillus macrosporangiidus]|uniref:GerA spore germination protein n=1 Tax=Alicyclobacillus macrosporangiidus TaxID=392015 RepID=A0A1I7K2V6_9BACL|nr:spore germination protein [Alicyclobacillus macrosporangiidus]SFU91776.1 GerA spore germination protein [Alicyclobacillus macrosporangiidus]
MNVPAWLARLFTIDDGVVEEPFSLLEDRPGQAQAGADTGAADGAGERNAETDKGGQGRDGESAGGAAPDAGDRAARADSPGQADSAREAGAEPGEVEVIRPIPLEAYIRQSAQASPEKSPEAGLEDKVPAEIGRVRKAVEQLFHADVNKDIVIREFIIQAESRGQAKDGKPAESQVPAEPRGHAVAGGPAASQEPTQDGSPAAGGGKKPWRALAVFVDGLVDKMTINTHILQPLMLLTAIADEPVERRLQTVSEALLPGNQVTKFEDWKDIVPGILSGCTAVFVDGSPGALIVETRGWEHRTVGLAQTETVVRGPHEGFTESFRANTGLVRAELRCKDLITEMMHVGRLAPTDVALMYVQGVVNPKLVDEVKRRIQAIDVDYLPDSGLLEQFIEDNPRLVVPNTLTTERPDRIAHMLMEGHVAIFVGNSPFAIAVPVVFWQLVHSPEDAYLRFPFGSFLRLLRWLALSLALLTPALYVSITNYHPEMIPTDLMLAIAGSREQVPFPVITEILMMEFSIELIREAGIRIPSVIGPTIGIVGALIIGQAAVQAGIVSPLLVIVIAVTALASFAIPNYNLAFGVRTMRFVFLAAAAVFGFYGLTLALCWAAARLAVQKSFGVPMLSPVAPRMDTSKDVFLRGPAFVMNQRPVFLQTQKAWREQPASRPWSKATMPNALRRFGDSVRSPRKGGKH